MPVRANANRLALRHPAGEVHHPLLRGRLAAPLVLVQAVPDRPGLSDALAFSASALLNKVLQMRRAVPSGGPSAGTFFCGTPGPSRRVSPLLRPAPPTRAGPERWIFR